jgi:hypothetical protein
LADKSDKGAESDQRNSGQVRHDDRGNAVWQWASDTARTAMASTSQLLRKLDLTSLSLESDQPKPNDEPEIRGTQPTKPAAVGKPKGTLDTRKGGFDPYSTNAGSAKRAASSKPGVSAKVAAQGKAATAAKAEVAATGAAKPVASAKPAAQSAAPTNRQPEVSPPRRASWWQRLLRRD